MKKILALLLAIVMVLGLAACGAKEETAAPAAPAATEAATEAAKEEAPAALPFEGQTLRVSTRPTNDEATTRAWFDKYLPEFEAITGAKVEVQLVTSSDLSTKQKADLAAGDAADVLTINGNQDYDYVKNGFVVELSNVVSPETIENNLFWDSKASFDGGHYLVPFDGGLAYRCFLINTDLCEELGLEVPEELTWDIMVEYGQKAVAAGYKGLVSPFSGNVNATWDNYFTFVGQCGGSLVGADGMWDFTSEEALEAMTFVYDLHNTYKIIDSVSYDDAGAVDQWVTGDTLFLGAPTYLVQPQVEQGALKFGWKIYHLKNEYSATTNVVDSYAINSASEVQDLAAAFIDWIMSPEMYTNFRECGAAATVKNPSAESLLIPEFQHLANSADIEIIPPATPHASEIGAALLSHQQLVAMGEETPEEALAALVVVVDGFRE